MKKKCTHKYLGVELFAQVCADGSLYKPWVAGHPDPIGWVCVQCKEYYSLGDANDDDPNVRLEILAAEIVADMNERGRNVDLKGGWQFGWWMWNDEARSERDGFYLITEMADGTRWGLEDLAKYPDWPAGWLARVIDQHGEPAKTCCASCGAGITPLDRCICWAMYPG